MYNKVIAHAPFMGHTGYANHAREFFTHLNKLIPVSMVSSTYDPSTDLNKAQLEMLEKKIIPDGSVHVVLETTDHPIFYEHYKGPKIAYNVWESTKQPERFFKRLLEYDQLWVPSEWQRECSIAQGYPEERVKVVREGLDPELFTPGTDREGVFKFLLIGRWEYRKSTLEILQAFSEEFQENENVELVCLVDNPFAVDEFANTAQRLLGNNITDSRIKILSFVSREEYVRLLQTCDIFVSCSRSEGWNLPLMEAIACGLPSVYSECSGQLEFTQGLKGILPVSVVGLTKPKGTYPKGSQFPGMWYEPDFEQLKEQLRYGFEYGRHPINIDLRNNALRDSIKIREEFTWDKAAEEAYRILGGELEKEILISTIGGKSSFFHVPEQTNLVDLTTPQKSIFGFTYKEIYLDKSYSYGPCRVEKGDVVVDCGANIGIFSRWAGEQGAEKVYSIEAEKGNFATLEKNLSQGNVFYNAVGKENKDVELYVHTLGGSHSIKDNDINHTQTEKRQLVQGITLDRFIQEQSVEKIDFLKIDTEGAELDIFAGISDENLQRVNKIAMEYHHMIYDFDVDKRQEMLDRLERNGFEYSMQWNPNGHLQMIYCWRGMEVEASVHFVNGPFCELLGEDTGIQYDIAFIDRSTREYVHVGRVKANNWVRASRTYFTNWLIEVRRVGDQRVIFQHEFDPTGKKIAVWLGSKSLGDTLAWFPYIEEFGIKHSCEVITATWWNELFLHQYPGVNFIPIGEKVDDLYASYTLGVFDNDGCKHRQDWRVIPLQQIASDLLGVSYKEIRPRVGELNGRADIEGEYICISEFSTAKCKLWNRLNGWQELVDGLVESGNKVVSISTEPSGLGKNVIKLNNREIQDTIATLKNAQLFIGVSSGLAWLAWSLGVPVILISGFTHKFCEFTTGIQRIINEDVCHGCFNDVKYEFDRGDWNWCPCGKDFECTQVITPEQVLDKVKYLKEE